MLRHDGVETPGESIQDESLTILAMAAQKQIHAGIDGVDGRGFDGHATYDRIHFKIVGDDDALETELTSKDLLKNARTQRRRSLGINCFEQDVRTHDGRDPGLHRGDEGTQFDATEAVEIMGKPREFEMAVFTGVTVAGKVLGTGCDQGVLHGLDPDRTQFSDEIGIAREGSIPDDGIVGIRIDIDHRCEIEVDTNGSEFTRRGRGRLSHGMRAEACEFPHGGNRRESIDQSSTGAALLVDGDHDRATGSLPKSSARLTGSGRIPDIATKKDDGRNPGGKRLFDEGRGLRTVESDADQGGEMGGDIE